MLVNSTGKVFHPHKTLREFARDVAPTMGPAAALFERLTGMVETSFYSDHDVTESEVDKGRQLTMKIERRLKGEDV